MHTLTVMPGCSQGASGRPLGPAPAPAFSRSVFAFLKACSRSISSSSLLRFFGAAAPGCKATTESYISSILSFASQQSCSCLTKLGEEDWFLKKGLKQDV